MGIKSKLEFLAHYYQVTRRVGHSYTLMHGTNDSKAIVIVPNMSLQSNFKPLKVVSINNLDSLRGSNAPLAFDNSTLEYIFNAAIEEINRLETALINSKRKPKHES